jgi:hypothetical protein
MSCLMGWARTSHAYDVETYSGPNQEISQDIEGLLFIYSYALDLVNESASRVFQYRHAHYDFRLTVDYANVFDYTRRMRMITRLLFQTLLLSQEMIQVVAAAAARRSSPNVMRGYIG